MYLINGFSWAFIRNIVVTSILWFTSSSLLFAEGWWDGEGNRVPDSDNMKSVGGFNGWLLVTSDPDWESKWESPSPPNFSEASEVAYGETLTILPIFSNPKVDDSGNIHIRCDIRVTRPDGMVSKDMKDVECAAGKLQDDPLDMRLTTLVIGFIGEESDPAGIWTVNVTLTDQNREVSVPLTSKFELSRSKIAKSTLLENFRFKSQEDVAEWMTYYYMNPEPDVLVEAIEYISLSGLLDNNVVPNLFSFLAGVFKDNPKRVPEWIASLHSLKESHFGIVVLGLWYANLPDSQKMVYAILEKNPDLKNQFSLLQAGSPMEIEQIPLHQGAWVLDALWGKFFATGSKEPVLRIMTTLPWLDVRGDVNRLRIGVAAGWSLSSNAVQHERVMQFCKEELKNQPEDIVEKLKEVIANTKEYKDKKPLTR